MQKQIAACVFLAQAQRILKGSKGELGGPEMPPNTAVPEAEATTLAKWILSLK